jgi:alginate O-acetyltransferase complex protein AlgJ
VQGFTSGANGRAQLGVHAARARPGRLARFLPLPVVRDDKVVEGRDGWLFLANDANRVLEQHAGRRRLSQIELHGWRRLLETRTDLVEGLGARYLAVVSPDAHSVYPDKLPEHVVPAPERPIHQLLDALSGSRARVLYPLPELRAARPRRDVYARDDSHWNQYGAFVAYRRLMDELEPHVAARRLAEDEVAFFEMEGGDLSYKLPGRSTRRTFAEVRAGGARLVRDNLVEGTGALMETECPDAPDSACMLFGDSCSYDLIRFLAESFGRFTFAHSVTLDRALIERERPDVVISLIAERFLVRVPDDLAAPRIAVAMNGSRPARRGRAVPAPWPERPYPSLRAVERGRAALVAAGRPMDAALVTTLAYAGLSLPEAARLHWDDVARGGIVVRAGEAPTGTRGVRMVRPLAEDLETWRRACAATDGLVFPGADPARWNGHLGELPALVDDLHHTFCLLLIYEGLLPAEVAQQAGRRPEAVAEDYADRFWIAQRSNPAPAEDRIIATRRAVTGRRP